MRLIAGFLLVAALVVTGCGSSGASVEGSGTPKTEVRALPPISAVEAGGALELVITVAAAQRVEVTADDNIVPLLTTVVDQGTLKVGLNGSVSTKTPVKVVLALTDVVRVAVPGAVTATVAGVKNDSFSVEMSGAGRLTCTGQTKSFKVELSGAGKVAADDLKSQNVQVDCSGAGRLEVHASESLTATVSGAGSVIYSGNPKTVKKEVSGVGSVVAR